MKINKVVCYERDTRLPLLVLDTNSSDDSIGTLKDELLRL